MDPLQGLIRGIENGKITSQLGSTGSCFSVTMAAPFQSVFKVPEWIILCLKPPNVSSFASFSKSIFTVEMSSVQLISRKSKKFSRFIDSNSGSYLVTFTPHVSAYDSAFCIRKTVCFGAHSGSRKC